MASNRGKQKHNAMAHRLWTMYKKNYMYTIRKFIAPLIAGALFINLNTRAQTLPPPAPEISKNWHLLDLKADGFYGISLMPAYQLIKGKKSKTVVVAVIDSGVDTAQKDLKPVLWVNTKEIAGNGKDDDNNGYTDDIHGWNFLGGPDGKANYTETTEEVREYNRLKSQYSGLTDSKQADKKEYAYWLKVKDIHDSTINKATVESGEYAPVLNALMTTSGYIKRDLKLPADASFKKEDLAKLNTGNDTIAQSKMVWESIFVQADGDTDNASVIKEISEYLAKLNNDLNPDLTSRQRIVGDNPDVWETKPYGSNLLKFPDATHGTGVSGLIGAVRGNNYGIDGVADNVLIMGIKAVPNGDEYDKDVAKAIRYAVDNGAKVINMSFGKKLSPHKKWVDDAFRYAAAKDVLLVQGSGNDGEDVDSIAKYPNDTFEDGSATDADNVLCVGASAAINDETLAGSFSNYGKKNVDVFAPGVKVTSLNMDDEFNTADGTSFSSPIVAGVAALVLEYYPKLSARQLKQVILQSAAPVSTSVIIPGGKETVPFATLSKTGGIVNAYKALQIAATLKGERK